MTNIIYPELSYSIVGVLYKIYNEIGGGYQEKVYQSAVKKEFINRGIGFIEQVETDLIYKGDKIGRYRLDFIIEHKIVLELKVSPRFMPRDIMQILGYLKKCHLELGILASLNRNSVIFKRLIRGK